MLGQLTYRRAGTAKAEQKTRALQRLWPRTGLVARVGAAVVHSVERHTAEKRFADDLTILLLRRCTTPAPAGV